ncbi:MAG TPA: hypothetical protein PKA13_14860 [Geminicoccaceae bacterium]|nr:hypothetical protein [Geminicoccus sp.]HMU51053.1 hypothetical protein [Geminicoccaceae bacterium]
MLELLILACLVREPSHCEAFRLPFAMQLSMTQCMWQSTLQAAEWGASHPDWVIRKISCSLPEA